MSTRPFEHGGGPRGGGAPKPTGGGALARSLLKPSPLKRMSEILFQALLSILFFFQALLSIQISFFFFPRPCFLFKMSFPKPCFLFKFPFSQALLSIQISFFPGFDFYSNFLFPDPVFYSNVLFSQALLSIQSSFFQALRSTHQITRSAWT